MASAPTENPASTNPAPTNPASTTSPAPANPAPANPAPENPAPTNPAPAITAPTALPAVDDVAADDYGSSADSAYDSEIASYTTSLASSIEDYKFQMGRRYHAYKEGAYMFPNDEKEQDRMDIMHKMIEVALGQLYLAPIKDPKRVLDIGTGTGIWALEFGDRFPQCDVLGNDLSPVQPRWVPPNVHFEVDDVEQPWTYAQKFDLVHCRSMYAAVRDWPRLVRQCFEFTRPGGWAEFCDIDTKLQSPDKSVIEGSPLDIHNNTFYKMTLEHGTEPDPGSKLEGWVRAQGFEDVQVRHWPLPLGTWAKDKHLKEIGSWMYLQTTEGLESFIAYTFTTRLGWSKDEVDVLCAKIRTQLKDPKVHGMLNLYNVVGRKPANAE